MKKIIILAALQLLVLACVMLTSSAYAADEKSKMTMAKVEHKIIVATAVSKPASRAMKVSASESTVYDYSLERNGCCFTR
jgi:hypothetical protein